MNFGTLGLMNALKYHWCETSLISEAVLKLAMSKDFIFQKSMQGTGSVSYQKQRNLYIYGIVSYQNFSCHVTLLLKGKLQHVGHKWVICGSHLDYSVNGSTDVTHFYP